MVSKVFIWLGKTVATVALTVVLTLWLSGLIMTSVVQSVLEEFEIPLQVEPAIYSGVLGQLWGYNNKEKEQVAIQDDQILNSDDTTEWLIDPSTVPSKVIESEPDQIEEQPAVEVLAPVEMGEKVEVSINDLDDARNSLTDEDKERLMELVVGKIPADQWQIISLYIEDGLSEKEILDTQQILAQYLTDTEYAELMSILKKS